MTLDIRTLSLTTVIHCTLFGLGLGLFALTSKRHRVVRWFAVGNLMFATGFLLLCLRGVIDQFLSVIVANTLIAGGFLAFHRGSFGFRKLRPDLMFVGVAGLAGTVALFVIFTYGSPNISARIIVINAYLLVETLMCTYAFARTLRRAQLAQDLVVTFAFVEFAVFAVLRMVWTAGEESPASFMDAGTVHGVSFIMVQLFTIQTSLALIWIATSELSRDLERQARIDPLTKTLNRRAFAEETNRELSRSRRTGAPLSILLVDLDRLKEVNDTYGHEAGDLALVSLAEEARSTLREDMIARFGGDEFAVLLPGTKQEDAVKAAERIRSSIESRQFGFGDRLVAITVSIGVATRGEGNDDIDEIIRRADVGLYSAKAMGRNRVGST